MCLGTVTRAHEHIHVCNMYNNDSPRFRKRSNIYKDTYIRKERNPARVECTRASAKSKFIVPLYNKWCSYIQTAYINYLWDFEIIGQTCFMIMNMCVFHVKYTWNTSRHTHFSMLFCVYSDKTYILKRCTGVCLGLVYKCIQDFNFKHWNLWSAWTVSW